MAADLAQTCPLCLQTDELASMVPVDLPHALMDNMKHPIVCRFCAFAIADCVEGIPRTPAPEPLDEADEKTEQ